MHRPPAIGSETGAELKPGVPLRNRCDRLRGFRGFELLPLTDDMRLKRLRLALEIAFVQTLQNGIERCFEALKYRSLSSERLAFSEKVSGGPRTRGARRVEQSADKPWILPSRGKVATACAIIAESAIFTIFVVAYLFYLGKSLNAPTPVEVVETPVFYTICLLSSGMERDNRGAFLVCWFLTVVLGGAFLFGTAQDGRRLITNAGSPSRRTSRERRITRWSAFMLLTWCWAW
jgi:hypothetical protein